MKPWVFKKTGVGSNFELVQELNWRLRHAGTANVSKGLNLKFLLLPPRMSFPLIYFQISTLTKGCAYFLECCLSVLLERHHSNLLVRAVQDLRFLWLDTLFHLTWIAATWSTFPLLDFPFPQKVSYYLLKMVANFLWQLQRVEGRPLISAFRLSPPEIECLVRISSAFSFIND